MASSVTDSDAASGPAPGLGHPYYPLNMQIPGFVPNDTSVVRLLPVFGGVIAAVVGSVLVQTAKSKVPLRRVDHFAAAWFALCGFLHVAFEGYYLYYRNQLPGMSTTFAQLWKEYALSDSRYLTNDAFTISVETITAIAWGPLSWLTVRGILANSRSRHVTQLVVCVAHLYGVALYYLTNWMEGQLYGVAYSRPEFLYYWVYYIGFNMPWAIVPVVLLWDSWQQVMRAFSALEEEEARAKKK
ncbi:Emopamil binding protein-domain-containing protein [Dactylonectria estremocensis]|uniref:Emopamil binding protein-domain-containing protein n=1 Tax=Dactylonectria estremocensis TaxID=1079267 RepID=A0A9P9FEG3_9HYPO|nr:Emopamil binding protein-domain-containing protein [Dactylonectria estremocensis]